MPRIKQPSKAPSQSLDNATVAFASYSPSHHPNFDGKTVAQLKTDIIACGGSYVTKLDTATHLIASETQFVKQINKVKEAIQDYPSAITIVSYDWLADSLASNIPVSVASYLLDQSSPVANGINGHAALPASNVKHDSTQSSKRKHENDNGDDEVNKRTKPSANNSKSTAKIPPATVVPVDDQVPDSSEYTVYVDDTGLPWDATLNQSNAGKNNNKFYRLQVLAHKLGTYHCWTRWGRVGERGQSKVAKSSALDPVIAEFKKKFKDKNGNPWETRDGPVKSGKYVLIEINYNESDDDDDDDDNQPPARNQLASTKKEEVDEEEAPPVESKLAVPVQKLMELIFNMDLFNATMNSLDYDATRMPLGKLSKKTLLKGYEVLKELAALIGDSGSASLPALDYAAAVEQRSNLYFSLVPHVVGRTALPILRDMRLIKKEIELLETLTDMQLANEIMKAAKGTKSIQDQVHILDRQFHGLALQAMTPLNPASKEFKKIDIYLNKSSGHTHSFTYQVEDIFRIERTGEDDRFQNSEYAKLGAKSDRRLLWHGSRCTNFGGILSQGLRIAPPEAPVSGYMFGKGVYLADMSTKSAGYCASFVSGGTGLLLLCEAELGKPPLKLTDADYDAGERAKKNNSISTWGVGSTAPQAWKDAGCIHKDLKGVQMPDVAKKPPAETNEPDAYLMYNEYIVYDVAQIKMRYLLRVKM